MRRMTHLSLFSGIGGLDLAAEAAGFQTVGQCEWADYPTKVLEKHWPEVPRWKDIRGLTGEDFFEKTGLRTVDVISGGFPCQPFSFAGKRRGNEDDRYLWPEMLRVIQEIGPRWVVGENVAGIVSMALDTVLSDLENLGYACQAFIIPAVAVDAPHRRDRCAIVAYSDSVGYFYREPEIDTAEARKPTQREFVECSDYVANANGEGLQRLKQHGAPDPREQQPESQGPTGERREAVGNAAGEGLSDWAGKQMGRCGAPQPKPERSGGYGGWWPAEPDVGRVAHGVPARVDRLKCLGNAVVPAQFYPIFSAIMAEQWGGQA